MTLGNMREVRVHHRVGFCLNDACRHALAYAPWPSLDAAATYQS
jgi:hypothetical protein